MTVRLRKPRFGPVEVRFRRTGEVRAVAAGCPPSASKAAVRIAWDARLRPPRTPCGVNRADASLAPREPEKVPQRLPSIKAPISALNFGEVVERPSPALGPIAAAAPRMCRTGCREER